jgi:hypothetical protein
MNKTSIIKRIFGVTFSCISLLSFSAEAKVQVTDFSFFDFKENEMTYNYLILSDVNDFSEIQAEFTAKRMYVLNQLYKEYRDAKFEEMTELFEVHEGDHHELLYLFAIMNNSDKIGEMHLSCTSRNPNIKRDLCNVYLTYRPQVI